ncbi:MAG TPA: lanthionine synthetase C family protein [Kofleriaceae bacterium]
MLDHPDADEYPAADHRWQPLLDGEHAAQARAVAEDIVLALEQQPPSQEHGLLGDASIALVLAHCGRPSADARLNSALNAIGARPPTISLFAGLSGVSWLIDHSVDENEAGALMAHFDAALLRYLDVPRWQERYDLISGLVGVGVYAAGCRSERAARIADHVLSHLEATAIADGAGTTWRIPPHCLPPPRRARFPDGAIDLGVSHGVPGIIGMLAQFVNAGVQQHRSRRLLRSAVAWLMNTVPNDRPRFGTDWPADPDEVKRMGWCYGDPGVAGALLGASRALRSPELEQEALALLTRIATPLATRGAPDACFCHGAAGLAHIYNVAFQRTGSVQMRDHAKRWLAELLRLRTPGTGIAGYQFLKADEDATHWAPDATLLSGATGVALVLLAAVEDEEPEWPALCLL